MSIVLVSSNIFRYFASYEAPYLRTGIVTDATVLLINENERQPSTLSR